MTRADFVRMLEEKLAQAQMDVSEVPFELTPEEGFIWRESQASIIQWVLEMMPE